MTFYIFHRHSLTSWSCGFNLQLYSWWEGFRSSSLATQPLGFNCVFIYISACGSSTGVCSWGCPGGLGFAPVRARCGGRCSCLGRRGSGSTRYSGVLAARAAGNTVLQKDMATSIGQHTPVFLPGEAPPWQRSLAGHSLTGSQRHYRSNPAHIAARLLFACGSSAPVRAERELAQLLGLWGLRRCQACRDTDCLCRRSYGPIGVFPRASASWRSEGLFGRSSSVTPPIQELRGLPSLRSLSGVCRVRHIERPPWVGSTL